MFFGNGVHTGSISVKKAAFPTVAEGSSASMTLANAHGGIDGGGEANNYLCFTPSKSGTYKISFSPDEIFEWGSSYGVWDSVGQGISSETWDWNTRTGEYELAAGQTYYIGASAMPGGSCTVSVTLSEVSATPVTPPCAFDELTNVDYLAFADLAYENAPDKGTTVKDMLGDKWTELWSNDITYADLYEHIQGWRFEGGIRNAAYGFYAMSFINDNNEVVITYRGSAALDDVLQNPDAWQTGSDWRADWIENNAEMLLNKNGSQVILAFRFYDMVKEGNPSAIGVTGHSLGGALGDIVSAYSGDKGVTFNAAPFLDIAYAYYPERMSKLFSGTDRWNFVDNINEDDIIGMFDSSIKPRTVYQNEGFSKSAHSLESLIYKNEEGELTFTPGINYKVDKTSWIMPEASITDAKAFLLNGRFIDFGTSGNDKFYGLAGAQSLWDAAYEVLSGVYARYSYGGDGADEIVSGLWSDTIIGGRGTDILSGNIGDDMYIYNKGDGVDFIIDRASDDCLYLLGFNNSDVIHTRTTQDSEYIDVYCNNDRIVRINKSCRDGWNLDNFALHVEKDGAITEKLLDSAMFSPKSYTRRMVIACPVDIQILNEQGKVVYTIKSEEPGAYYTEYGDFYVYEEENGEYSKIVDLVEGYSVKIIGTDTGIMNVAVQEISSISANAYISTDIPITNATIATIEIAEDSTYLAFDEDGNGTIDEEIYLELVIKNPFTDILEEAYYYDFVLWAVENGITNGTSATTFSPNASCTRAQAVTFLWRAAGSPEPVTTLCPFTDMDMGSYYGKAVLWAVEDGVTNGTSADAFSPDAICTRAQIVTLLWRAAGSPAPASTVCPFTDVDVDSYYGKAVLWAVENGITNGTSATTFSPDNNCTRAQIVTFLWRFMGN